jgi:hypothetical protein
VGLPSGMSSDETLPKNGRLPSPITTGSKSTATSSSSRRSRHWRAMVPALTTTARSPASYLARATAALTPSVTNVNGASGCASTQSVWDLVADDHDRYIEVVLSVPAVGDFEQRSASDQRANRRHPPAPVLGALCSEMNTAAWARHRDSLLRYSKRLTPESFPPCAQRALAAGGRLLEGRRLSDPQGSSAACVRAV